MSASNYTEDATLNAIFNNVPLQKAARYLKLHVGDPGETGTANAAVETTRKSITGAAAVAGVFTSVNDLIWLGVAAAETYSHASIWDDPTAGNCLWTAALESPQAVEALDDFSIPAGQLDVTVD